MKRSYIMHKGNVYPINICTFYKDCVHVMDYDDMSGLLEFVAPNGTFDYVEEEIEVNPLNYQTHIDNEQARKERRQQAFDLAKSSFPYEWPKNPYQEQIERRDLYPYFTDYLFDRTWETEDDEAYPFFDREVYKQFKIDLENYKSLWHAHLDFFLEKAELNEA